jgi:hypothetical protein
MLSEDKISHLSHVILQVVKKSPLVTVQAIDRKVKAKLASYSRGIVEGSAEWEVLYRKTFEEETRKHAKG